MALSKDDIKEKDEGDIRKPTKKMGWVNEDEKAGDKRYDANVRDFFSQLFWKERSLETVRGWWMNRPIRTSTNSLKKPVVTPDENGRQLHQPTSAGHQDVIENQNDITERNSPVRAAFGPSRARVGAYSA
ncbi:hypothetical protein WR25_25843 [Diploscapter pachys]|uniref:Uncharacterized protein n=1 Tax=Diploscapter pachys TaxID=2018661 RepID=A0A2A2JM14_9BILA|nr:hypothetical protein WR25_25843 [Diploscapter pachys]